MPEPRGLSGDGQTRRDESLSQRDETGGKLGLEWLYCNDQDIINDLVDLAVQRYGLSPDDVDYYAQSALSDDPRSIDVTVPGINAARTIMILGHGSANSVALMAFQTEARRDTIYHRLIDSPQWDITTISKGRPSVPDPMFYTINLTMTGIEQKIRPYTNGQEMVYMGWCYSGAAAIPWFAEIPPAGVVGRTAYCYQGIIGTGDNCFDAAQVIDGWVCNLYLSHDPRIDNRADDALELADEVVFYGNRENGLVKECCDKWGTFPHVYATRDRVYWSHVAGRRLPRYFNVLGRPRGAGRPEIVCQVGAEEGIREGSFSVYSAPVGDAAAYADFAVEEYDGVRLWESHGVRAGDLPVRWADIAALDGRQMSEIETRPLPGPQESPRAYRLSSSADLELRPEGLCLRSGRAVRSMDVAEAIPRERGGLQPLGADALRSRGLRPGRYILDGAAIVEVEPTGLTWCLDCGDYGIVGTDSLALLAPMYVVEHIPGHDWDALGILTDGSREQVKAAHAALTAANQAWNAGGIGRTYRPNPILVAVGEDLEDVATPPGPLDQCDNPVCHSMALWTAHTEPDVPDAPVYWVAGETREMSDQVCYAADQWNRGLGVFFGENTFLADAWVWPRTYAAVIEETEGWADEHWRSHVIVRADSSDYDTARQAALDDIAQGRAMVAGQGLRTGIERLPVLRSFSDPALDLWRQQYSLFVFPACQTAAKHLGYPFHPVWKDVVLNFGHTQSAAYLGNQNAAYGRFHRIYRDYYRWVQLDAEPGDDIAEMTWIAQVLAGGQDPDAREAVSGIITIGAPTIWPAEFAYGGQVGVEGPARGAVAPRRSGWQAPRSVGRDGFALRFHLSEKARVTLRIYDVHGRLVRSLVDEPLGAGEHEASWDGKDALARHVANGVYFARLVAQRPGGRSEMLADHKLVVVR